LPVTDLLFRPLYAFFIVEWASRRVVHVGVTRHPRDPWVAQQRREATPYGRPPTHLITDHDSTYGPAFARVARVSGIDLVHTADQAPRMNALCARFLGSVRRECLDHVVVLGESQLRRVLKEYVPYFNHSRRHQGINPHLPDGEIIPGSPALQIGPVWATSILGGLHHAYCRAA
jgi:putative transposase